MDRIKKDRDYYFYQGKIIVPAVDTLNPPGEGKYKNGRRARGGGAEGQVVCVASSPTAALYTQLIRIFC
jgi:hypothetical protein